MNIELLPQIPQAPSDPAAASPIALPSPARMKTESPISDRSLETVRHGRLGARRILTGDDDQRLILLCGPCSIHCVDGALEYARRLRRLAATVEDRLLILMRVYFEKPRTVGGWKGLVYDADLSGGRATLDGLKAARDLLRRITEIGVPCATEFLSPLVSKYLEDLVSYGTIGARTVESQIHRELAAQMDAPMGMKNATDGEIESAINAIHAARRPHCVFGYGENGEPVIQRARGNPFAHLVLRGGRSGPNLGIDRVLNARARLKNDPLGRPIVIDCSHANSSKDFRRQSGNALDVLGRFAAGESVIAGLMLESNLEEGRQEMSPGSAPRSGKSVTDGCIGWEETASLVERMAGLLR